MVYFKGPNDCAILKQSINEIVKCTDRRSPQWKGDPISELASKYIMLIHLVDIHLNALSSNSSNQALEYLRDALVNGLRVVKSWTPEGHLDPKDYYVMWKILGGI